MAKKQFYGIRYPFQNEDEEGYFIDLNKDYIEKIRSEVIHLVFTPERQRIRMPEFGTNLMKYIFEPNDNVTHSQIMSEIQEKMNTWIPNVTLKDINIEHDEHNANVRIEYTIHDGNRYMDDNISMKI